MCYNCKGTGWITLFTSKEPCDCSQGYDRETLSQLAKESKVLSERIFKTSGTYTLHLMWWGTKSTPIDWPSAQSSEYPKPYYLQDRATIVSTYIPRHLRTVKSGNYATFIWMPTLELMAKLRELHTDYDLGFRDPVLEIRWDQGLANMSLKMGGVCPERLPPLVLWKAEGLRRYVTGEYE